jgi:threonine synthase
MEFIEWLRATCMDEHGRRYPDSYSYYRCPHCGEYFKERRYKPKAERFEKVPPEEAEKYRRK